MKIDLVGPARRGLAMGLNEAAGYLAVAVTALATGYLAEAYGLRPAPFLLGLAFAALGLGLSALAVRETRGHARLEAAGHRARADGRHDHLHGELTDRRGVHPDQLPGAGALVGQPGRPGQQPQRRPRLGPLPDPVRRGRPVASARIGVLAALYPAVWGLGQLVTGALSDRWGRKWLIASGMWVQACALGLDRSRRARSPPGRSPRCSSAPAPRWSTRRCSPPSAMSPIRPGGRARSGVYRLWRDGGFAVGALLAGIVADAFGIRAAMWAVAALTAASGIVVAVRMYETHHRPDVPSSTTGALDE